ncbi:MAG: DNA cytosine methyltransferase [Clostridiales bacterium]|nr:DNA cytosine methyltransferase [Clostridiales bacterium]
MHRFTFIDLFSGIGGFRIALDALGGRCLGFSEIDKPCIGAYIDNFGDSANDNLGDITEIRSIPQTDLLVGGVPCQSWSVAGKMLGFADPRGKLWHDAVRLVRLSLPKVFIFENVKGLCDPRNTQNLDLILNSFRELGYIVKADILNSYDFGVPQIRARIFIVGFRDEYASNFSNFAFPIGSAVHDNLAKYLDGVENRDVDKRKFAPEELFGEHIPKARNAFQKEDELNDFFTLCDTRNGHSTIHSWDLADTTTRQKDIMIAIMKNRRRKQYGNKDGNPLSSEDIREFVPDISEEELGELVSKGLLRKPNGRYEFTNSKNSSGIGGVYRMYMPYSKIFSTLTASGTRDVVVTDYIKTDVAPDEYKREFLSRIIAHKKYRPPSVAETQRIQGFPDSFRPHHDERVAKKQFGNAVSPPVVEALTRQILDTGVFEADSRKPRL